jgi:iron(III) transport system permease protein
MVAGIAVRHGLNHNHGTVERTIATYRLTFSSGFWQAFDAMISNSITPVAPRPRDRIAFIPRSVRRRSTWLILVMLAVAGLLLTRLLDTRTHALVLNTLLLSVSTCCLSLPASFLLAWRIHRAGRVGEWFVIVLIASLFMPLYLQLTGWQAGLGQQGWLQAITGSLSSRPVLAGWRGAVWVHAVAAVPWATLIFVVGLRAVPRIWEETAMLEAGPWRSLWFVLLPATVPAWTVASLWVFALTAGEMTVTDVYRIRTFAEETFLDFALGDPQSNVMLSGTPVAGQPAAPFRPTITFGLGMTLWLVCAMSVALRSWLAHGYSAEPGLRPMTSRHAKPVRSLLLFAIIALILWGIPVGNLIYNAGHSTELQGDRLVRHWSAWQCVGLVLASPWQFRRDFVWSFTCGNLAAIGTLACAIPLAWGARTSRTISAVFVVLIAVCLVVPGPVVGISIIGLFDRRIETLRFLYDRTLIAPCLAMAVHAFPLVGLITLQAFKTLPQVTLDAALLDGARSWRMVLLIAIPQRAALLLCAWLVGLAVALADLAGSILVAPPGVNTLAITIFGLVHYGVDDRLAALCLSVCVLCGVAGGVAAWLFVRNRPRETRHAASVGYDRIG